MKDNEMKDSLSEDNLVISRYIQWYHIRCHISFQSRARLSRLRSHVLAASKVTGELPNILCNAYISYVLPLGKTNPNWLCSYVLRTDDELLYNEEKGERGERA